MTDADADSPSSATRGLWFVLPLLFMHGITVLALPSRIAQGEVIDPLRVVLLLMLAWWSLQLRVDLGDRRSWPGLVVYLGALVLAVIGRLGLVAALAAPGIACQANVVVGVAPALVLLGLAWMTRQPWFGLLSMAFGAITLVVPLTAPVCS